MWSRAELVNKVMDDVIKENRGAADGILDISIFDVRRIVENTVEETQRHIAKKIVETRIGLIEVLVQNGFFDEDENVEELIYNALGKL